MATPGIAGHAGPESAVAATRDPSKSAAADRDLVTLMWSGCARCGKAPPSLDPLTPGWTWDTEEPDNPWLWCPHWHLPNGCKDAGTTPASKTEADHG